MCLRRAQGECRPTDGCTVLQPFTPGCNSLVTCQQSCALDQHASGNKLNAFGPYVQAEYMQLKQQADLSSPFCRSQEGFQTNLVPLGVTDKKLLCDTGSYAQHIDSQHSDLTAATAASLEKHHFHGFNTSGSEVCMFWHLCMLKV